MNVNKSCITTIFYIQSFFERTIERGSHQTRNVNLLDIARIERGNTDNNTHAS